MRMLCVINDQERAGRFGDYLLSRGIQNLVEPGSGGWLVWVADDDKLEPAKEELKAFEADPEAEQFKAAGPHAKRIRLEYERRVERRAGMEVDVRTQWFSGVTRPTPVTVALITLCFIIGLVTKVGYWGDGGPDVVTRTLVYSYPLHEPATATEAAYRKELGKWGMGRILRGEVWRIVSPMVLHFGILHLLFNMLWMADLGILIERKRGAWWYVFFILGAAAVSNTAEHFITIDLRHGGILFNRYFFGGGMSGVVYALFGYAWIRGRFAPYDRIAPSPQTRAIMLIWLFACMSGFLGPVANTAHLTGMLFGMAVAYVPVFTRQLRRQA